MDGALSHDTPSLMVLFRMSHGGGPPPPPDKPQLPFLTGQFLIEESWTVGHSLRWLDACEAELEVFSEFLVGRHVLGGACI